jgi:DNA (cytosine-5)-methyltransferase 1
LPNPDRDTSISDSLTCSQQAAVIAPSLTASNDPSRGPQSSGVTQQVAACYAAAMQVRRLTPRECERLQGFPDDYTDIKPKGKPTPDGPRYKALGNSRAVPVVRWIGKRIANELA